MSIIIEQYGSDAANITLTQPTGNAQYKIERDPGGRCRVLRRCGEHEWEPEYVVQARTISRAIVHVVGWLFNVRVGFKKPKKGE